MSTPVKPPKFISTQVSEMNYYFLDLVPEGHKPLAVVCGGRERCNPEYYIDRRNFPFHSIEYVAEGRGELRLRGQRQRLQAGMAFYYSPGLAHAIRNDPHHPMVKYFVDFAGRDVPALMQASPLANGPVGVAAPAEIQELFEDLQRQGSRENALSAEICAALVRVLILKLGAMAVPSGVGDARALATYQRCKQMIEKNFLTLHSLKDIAAACHVDQAYMCRLFKRFDHVSPYRYLSRLKMNRAAELLLGSGRLVKEVADAVGFGDPYHFSRVFKSVHHVSPVPFIQRGHRRGGERSVRVKH